MVGFTVKQLSIGKTLEGLMSNADVIIEILAEEGGVFGGVSQQPLFNRCSSFDSTDNREDRKSRDQYGRCLHQNEQRKENWGDCCSGWSRY